MDTEDSGSKKDSEDSKGQYILEIPQAFFFKFIFYFIYV